MYQFEGHPDDPIDSKDLHNPFSKIARMIFYIHSLETPLFEEINLAGHELDKSMIPILGPYSFSLHTLLASGEKNKYQVFEKK